jgi:hypothetical protein
LLIGESCDGIIKHWDLIDGSPKPDIKHIDGLIDKIEGLTDNLKPSHLVGDRRFYSARTEKNIKEADLISNMCPKDLHELAERLGYECFKKFTKRRAQSEARVGILKNNFLGGKMLAHGFENQDRHVAWGVIAHNLWVLARSPYKDLIDPPKAA